MLGPSLYKAFRASALSLSLSRCSILTQTASLTAVSTQKLEHLYEPFPYWKRRYNYLWMHFDFTKKRMNDNSKVIIVDGNLATGKTAFAKRLAKEFDLHYIPPTTSDTMYINKWTNFDFRKINYKLPESQQIYDLKAFYEKPGRRVGLFQWHMVTSRVLEYQAALVHMFNTGQGVVMERSAFSDVVFAEALLKLGYFDQHVMDWYEFLRENLIIDLWRPHLNIYIDASVDKVMENVKRRNIPYEVNSSVMTKEYLQAIENGYKERLFPYMERHSHLLKYNINEVQTDEDWELIKEDLECLDLDGEEQSIFQKDNHKDWTLGDEKLWNQYRHDISDPYWIYDILEEMPVPTECLDLIYRGENFYNFADALYTHPGLEHVPTYHWKYGDRLIDIMFPFLPSKMKETRRLMKNDIRRCIFDMWTEVERHPKTGRTRNLTF